MKQFHWKAGRKNGPVERGVLLAETKEEAARLLLERYDYLVSVKARRFIWQTQPKKMTDQEKETFFRQLGLLLKSRVPLLKALDIMGFRSSLTGSLICRHMRQDLARGLSLSQSLERHKTWIDELACPLTAAGERSGRTAQVFLLLADSYQRRRKWKGMLLGACLYPSMVLVTGCLLLCFFVVFVLPVFADLYSSFGLAVPMGLRLVLLLRTKLTLHPLCFLILSGSVCFLCRLWFRHSRPMVEQLFIIREWRRTLWEVRYTSLLSMLLQSGLTLSEALQSAVLVLPHGLLRQSGMLLVRSVSGGSSISDAARKAPLLCGPLTVEFMAIGEESGQLATMLKEVSLLLEQDIKSRLQRIRKIIEPALLVVLAGIGLFLMYSILSPLMGLIEGIPARF